MAYDKSYYKILVLFALHFICVFKIQGISSEDEISSPRSSVCQSVTNAPSSCIKLEKCEYFKNLIERNPFSARRLIFESICSSGFNDLKVCCPHKQHGNKQENNNGHKEVVKHGAAGSKKTKALEPPQCGYSDKPHDRVVGGNPAVLGAWPWIALIGYSASAKSRSVQFRCGGALISSRYVVTAAHCVHGEKDLRWVRLGEHEINNEADGSEPIDVKIEKAIVHPDFIKRTLENDIALLKLSREVKFTDAVHPICLPVGDDIKNRNLVRHHPFLVGWGATKYNGTSSKSLMEAQVPVADSEECKSSYNRVKNTVIDDRVLCAGYSQGGTDACQGDSGGPLMYPFKNNYYLIGIVSGGYKCAVPGYPGVYTRVTSFLNFLLSNMD